MAEPEQPPVSTLEAMQQDAQALDEAIARATNELQELTGAASQADHAAELALRSNAEVREVPGVGRYAIPTVSGWEALCEVIRDKSIDVNYSPTGYPSFDGIVQKFSQNAFLEDPDQPEYDTATYIHLRDNIAAVRNFLMETYYANTPAGMSSGDAKRSLEEIAQFVGEGLHNNYMLLHLLPNHDPSKTFIDLDAAAEPHGKGAQYLYEEILKHQRQSSWMRPFAAVVELFGGKKPVDWMLPSAMQTPFVLDAAQADTLYAMEDQAAARLRDLQNQRGRLDQAMEMTALAIDMEAVGNSLLATAQRLGDPNQMAEPVQRRAIDIAKDILNKMRLTIGDKQVKDGMQLSPQDDRATVSGIQGVAMVYERLLAWGRGIDPSIAQHPSVMAATQAVGQFGYLAKMEALRVAKAVGNTVLADRIAARIAALPDAYKNTSAQQFGELLNRVENGINTVLDRIQAIQGPGASVGHTPYKELGSYMSGAPIAGLAMQLSGDGSNRDAAGKRNAEMLAAEEAVAQSQAARINSQTAARSQQQGQTQQAPSRPARGQQAVQQARRQSSSVSTTSTTNATMTNLSAQQRAIMLRQAAFRAAHAHDDEHHDHHPAPHQIDPRLTMSPALLNKINAAKLSSGIQNVPLGTAKGTPQSMGYGLKPMATPNLKPAATPVKPMSDEEKHKQQLIDSVAPGAPKGPGGIGR